MPMFSKRLNWYLRYRPKLADLVSRWNKPGADDTREVTLDVSFLEELGKGPSMAHAVTKKQLAAEWNVSIEEALEMEAQAQAHCMETRDFHRAYEAFAAKRTPEFQGD